MYNCNPRRRKNGQEAIFEQIMAETFLKLMKDIKKKPQQIPKKTNVKKAAP